MDPSSGKHNTRTNPMTDKFFVRRFHHIEFWGSDATTTSRRLSLALGMSIVAKPDLSTGNTTHASYLLRSGELLFLFTAPYSATISPDMKTASMPTFSHAAYRAFTASHGLGVRSIAFETLSLPTPSVFLMAPNPHRLPSPSVNPITIAEIEIYKDVVFRYISFKNPTLDITSTFLLGFELIETNSSFHQDFGIRRFDHATSNLPELDPIVNYIKSFTGFHEFAEFSAEQAGSHESTMNSMILASNNEMIILGLNEPVYGTKRRSQIETFVNHNEGPGFQHLALESEDIFRTLREMKQRSNDCGLEFMPPPPPTYYRNLKNRLGDVLSNEQMEKCEELGILVDRDQEGTLLQIFTKPLGDRPTIFLEIIQRVGCMLVNDSGKMQQKPGCGGFGKGNVPELFKTVEEYEKTFETRPHGTSSPN